MSKISCAVMRDLLPSYSEGLTSEETNVEIMEHLEMCGECRKLCEIGKPELEIPRRDNSKKDRRIIRGMRLKFLWYAFWPTMYAVMWQFDWQSRIPGLFFLGMLVAFIPARGIYSDTYFDDDKRKELYRKDTSPFDTALFLALPIIIPMLLYFIPLMVAYANSFS